MPPVSQQGSRAALVTWSVVTGILFVVATIFAIYFYVNESKTATKLNDDRKTYKDIISDADLGGQQVAELKSARANATEGATYNTNTPLFNVLLAERDALAKTIGGAAASDAAAQVAATKALSQAAPVAKQVGLTVPATDNLALAVNTLSDGLKTLNQRNTTLQKELTGTKTQMTEQVKQFEAARAGMEKSIAQARDEQKKAADDLAAYQKQKDDYVGQIEKQHQTQVQTLQDAQDKARVQLADRDRQVGKLQQDLETLRVKYEGRKIDTRDTVTRQADGKIIRIPARDVVYINLGSADSLTPGLTFEVYDKFEGIPAAGDPANDENLPKGKASIEVTRVGVNSSECRVVRQTLGTQITEGDLIANLVYDPNVKYNFMVYGDFDVDQNGIATAQETDIVKRLITQWGGKLTDKVNVDTDFVVLGKEPVLPSFTREDLQDPFNAKKLADAQTALDNYQAVKKQAVELKIPVLNQNRFLYLIGYFSQAKR